MDPDHQEALSRYQAHGLWLLPLSSGNWAVVLAPSRVVVLTRLEESALRELAEGERDRQRTPAAAPATADDLGL